jgi:DNA-binding transcriptional LysR family regulator
MAKLIKRTTRKINLTDIGRDYYRHCRTILADINEAESRVKKGINKAVGTLRISSTATFSRLFILPVINDLLVSNVEMSADIIIDDGYVDLIKHGVDVAVRVGPNQDSSLIARKIGEGERVLVASPEYLKCYAPIVTVSDLADHHCLTYTREHHPEEWSFSDKNRNVERVKVNSRFSSNNPDLLNQSAIEGMGLALVMLWTARDDIVEGRLVQVLPEVKPDSFSVNVVYPERKFTPVRVNLFIDQLRQTFNKRYKEEL